MDRTGPPTNSIEKISGILGEKMYMTFQGPIAKMNLTLDVVRLSQAYML